MRLRLLVPFFLACTWLTLSGCTPTRVFVDGIASGKNAAGPRFVLLSSDREVPEGDLQFQEYASYISVALRNLGYEESSDVDDADPAVFLRYGVGDPQREAYSFSLPVYGQTGGGRPPSTPSPTGPVGTPAPRARSRSQRPSASWGPNHSLEPTPATCATSSLIPSISINTGARAKWFSFGRRRH